MLSSFLTLACVVRPGRGRLQAPWPHTWACCWARSGPDVSPGQPFPLLGHLLLCAGIVKERCWSAGG